MKFIKHLLFGFVVAIWANYVVAAQRIPVVVSFSILANIVQQIGGDKISVTSLVGANQDIHDYEPRPADLLKINQSKILFVNGMGLETGFVNRIIKSYKGVVVIASNGITPLKFKLGVDPHIWSDPNNVINYYVPNILKGLIRLSPENRAYFTQQAKIYTKELANLNNWIIQQLKAIPISKRQAVTTHDAFKYFATRYQIRFFYAKGISTDSEATAMDIANLERLIKSNRVKVVFLENMTNNKLITQIADDTGASIGGKLYSDALSLSNQPADNYIDMVRANVNTLVKAWK